jgi:hypothetical protein
MKINNLVAVFWILFFITACNDTNLSLTGGGIGGTGNPFPDGGITDPIPTTVSVGESINIGPITGFNQVFVNGILVNGIEYDLSQAEIVVNGQAATAADLKLGMIVQVQGTITDEDNKTGTANRIEANENVVGPLQSIDEVNSKLTVLGQTVIINPFTILDGFADISELKSNNILAVSGLTNEMGHILATRIALVLSSNSFQVRGRASLDAVEQTATMGHLTIDCSQTPFAETTTDEMHLLDAKGKLFGNRLIAEQCQLVEPIEWNNFAAIRLEGVITRFNTATDFDVDQLPVTVSPTTQFQLGTVTDLTLGSRLKVTGSRDENGILVAEEIQFFNLTHYMSIKAPIETIDTDSKQINLLGIPSQLNNDTVFIDKADESTPFNWQALRVGDWVQVHGFIDLNTHLPVIEQLQRQVTHFGENNVELMGHPNTIEVSTRTLNFFGIMIMADGSTRYRDNRTATSTISLTASEFFSRIRTIKPLIAVEGQWFSNVMIAQQMVILPE